MRKWSSLALVITVALAFGGCGGGGSGINRAPVLDSSQLDISGAWNVKLSTSQARIVDTFGFPHDLTQINIKFKQTALGSGLLQVNDPISAQELRCRGNSLFGWFGGGTLEFQQGSVSNGSVGFKLFESSTGFAETGTLIFTGNYNFSNGTLAGNFTDSCTLQNGSWTASPITSLP